MVRSIVGAAIIQSPVVDAKSGLATPQWQKWFSGVATTVNSALAVVSFGSGAPTGTTDEASIYFDTSGSPYHGYVFHSGAWHQFS